ncbi:TonB-dependent receptor [Flavobacterium sp. 5]|uniref:SusC/RagA family TonB-linked outer membrane protein n=1 Tax=Flavobacterium sp. 5 TaxID=2035199 RepID=UPI000CBCCB8E|nr:TonB-dependent receptor [Flavobacterium sp. 5]PKB16468.1 TonB-linked SusC/RagA family outer membrane protein [Flavobacterium sp. 5]
MKNAKNLNQLTWIKDSLLSKFTLLIFIMTCCISLQAQNKISGSVIDQKTSQTIIGASILVKGTTNSATTDYDGSFTLDVSDPNAILVFSYVGYEKVEEALNGRTQIKVALKEENNALNEVIVIGYGTIKKSDMTGAVGGLKSSQLDSQSNTNVGSAIQGKIAGVTVESAGGAPGSGTRIQIRGAGSLNNNNPLILVDDIAVSSMNNLNPSDIESIQVLKDASAAAIYGSRAANGVILVTTKSGKKGDLKVSFNSSIGVSSVTNTLDLLNQEEWAKVSTAAYAAAGKAPLAIALNPEVGGAGVDWQDQIFRSAATQNYSLGLSGGTDNTKYSMSLSYFDQEGVVKETNYDRLNFRVKSDYKKGIFKIGETVMLTKEKKKDLPGVPGQGSNVVGSAISMIPGFAIYDENAVGGYGGASGAVTDIFNPVAALNLFDVKNDYYQALINTYVEASFLDGFKYKLNVGATISEHKSYTYTPRYEVGGFFKNLKNTLAEGSDMTQYYQVENTLNYAKTFGKHSVNILAGYTVYNNNYRSNVGSVTGLPDGIHVMAGGEEPSSVGYASENNLVSYLGRAIYSYDNKYILTATFRRDGSSRFSPENKWGNFPSISAAWGIGKEDFFTKLNTPISDLKLRASYGVLGNQEIGDYQYLGSITSGISYAVGEPNTLWIGNIQQDYPALGLKWESTATANVGLDVSLWNGKVDYTFDYFQKETSDLLLRVPVPLSVGSANDPYTNAGKVSNKGFEMGLTYNEHVGAVNFSVSANISSVNNRVDELSTGSQVLEGSAGSFHGAPVTYSKVGSPIYSFFLVKTDGLFRSQAEIDEHSINGVLIQPRAKVGDIRYVDYNGDGQIDGNDRQYRGSAFPDYEYGFRIQADWKGLDFTIVAQGTQGNKIYNGNNTDIATVRSNINYSAATLDSYTFNPNSNFPRLDIEDLNDNGADYSDRFLEDGSYLRIKTIQVGYALPSSLTDKIKIDKLRFYLAGDNLFTHTNYTGYNPDVSRDGLGGRGIDYKSYPLSKTITFGMQLNF